jgi:hypothetical protein
MSENTKSINIPINDSNKSNFKEYSYKLGKFIGKWGKKLMPLIKVLLILVLIYILIKILMDTDIFLNSRIAEISGLSHTDCSEHNYCSNKCPYDISNPKIAIKYKVKEINNVIDLIEDAITNEHKYILRYKSNYPKLENSLQTIEDNQNSIYVSILDIKTKIESISNISRGQGDDSVKLYNNQNKIIGLSSAFNIYRDMILTNIIMAHAMVANENINDELNNKATTIIDIDKSATIAINTYKDIILLSNTILTSSSVNTIAINDLVNNVNIIENMVKLADNNTDIHNKLIQLMANFNSINTLNGAIVESKNKDTFNNDMPGVVSNAQAIKLISENNYEKYVRDSALEPSIIDNHKKFAKERSTFNTSVDVLSVRDDTNDLNPWVAYSRPTFSKSNGADIAVSNVTLTSIPSENPETLQIRKQKNPFYN